MHSYSSCGCDVCVSVAIWFPATAYVKLSTPFYRRMRGFNVSVFMAPIVRPEGTGMTIYTSVPGSNSYEGFAVDPLWNRGLPMNTSSSADAMDIEQLYVLGVVSSCGPISIYGVWPLDLYQQGVLDMYNLRCL